MSPPEIATAGDSVWAQISGLAPKQLHMLRVIALDAKGVTLWEAPLVALAPPPQSDTAGRGWLMIFATALGRVNTN